MDVVGQPDAPPRQLEKETLPAPELPDQAALGRYLEPEQRPAPHAGTPAAPSPVPAPAPHAGAVLARSAPSLHGRPVAGDSPPVSMLCHEGGSSTPRSGGLRLSACGQQQPEAASGEDILSAASNPAVFDVLEGAPGELGSGGGGGGGEASGGIVERRLSSSSPPSPPPPSERLLSGWGGIGGIGSSSGSVPMAQEPVHHSSPLSAATAQGELPPAIGEGRGGAVPQQQAHWLAHLARIPTKAAAAARRGSWGLDEVANLF